jgi:hypothetical protein
LGAWSITQEVLSPVFYFYAVLLKYLLHQVLMWNFALDGSGNPKLPGADSCGGSGCRPLVTVNSDGSFSPNQECTSSHHDGALHNHPYDMRSLGYGPSIKSYRPKRSRRPLWPAHRCFSHRESQLGITCRSIRYRKDIFSATAVLDRGSEL